MYILWSLCPNPSLPLLLHVYTGNSFCYTPSSVKERKSFPCTNLKAGSCEFTNVRGMRWLMTSQCYNGLEYRHEVIVIPCWTFRSISVRFERYLAVWCSNLVCTVCIDIRRYKSLIDANEILCSLQCHMTNQWLLLPPCGRQQKYRMKNIPIYTLTSIFS